MNSEESKAIKLTYTSPSAAYRAAEEAAYEWAALYANLGAAISGYASATDAYKAAISSAHDAYAAATAAYEAASKSARDAYAATVSANKSAREAYAAAVSANIFSPPV